MPKIRNSIEVLLVIPNSGKRIALVILLTALSAMAHAQVGGIRDSGLGEILIAAYVVAGVAISAILGGLGAVGAGARGGGIGFGGGVLFFFLLVPGYFWSHAKYLEWVREGATKDLEIQIRNLGTRQKAECATAVRAEVPQVLPNAPFISVKSSLFFGSDDLRLCRDAADYRCNKNGYPVVALVKDDWIVVPCNDPKLDCKAPPPRFALTVESEAISQTVPQRSWGENWPAQYSTSLTKITVRIEDVLERRVVGDWRDFVIHGPFGGGSSCFVNEVKSNFDKAYRQSAVDFVERVLRPISVAHKP